MITFLLTDFLLIAKPFCMISLLKLDHPLKPHIKTSISVAAVEMIQNESIFLCIRLRVYVQMLHPQASNYENLI